MVSVFFADTDEAEARQTSMRTSIILAGPCGHCENIQTSFTYSTPHTKQRTQFIAGSGPIDVGGSFRCTSSAKKIVSLLNRWRTTVGTAAKYMLNNNRDSTHSCRSPCFTSNQSEQTPSSDQGIISS